MDPTRMGKTITSAVADRLRDQIRVGLLSPGVRLRQNEVAKEFNVSTTPVREAFMLLEREGLLTRFDHRGVVVFNPTVTDLQEIYTIRIPLEALATEKAVPRLTPQDLETMERLLIRSEEAHVDHDIDASSALNEDFHATIYDAAGMPRLVMLIHNLRSASASYIRLSSFFKPARRDTEQEHRAILEACVAKAPRRAAKAITHHLEHTVEVVSAGLASLNDSRPQHGRNSDARQ
jgi:DNA-binding GntR family transcriptional regulator